VRRIACTALWAIVGLLIAVAGTKPLRAQGDLQKVKHIIVVMQENHSFDNYFGALAYAPGSPYHGPGGSEHEWSDRDEHGGCREGDHRCVDGLSCLADATGELHCFNANIDKTVTRCLRFMIRAAACSRTWIMAGWGRTRRRTSLSPTTPSATRTTTASYW
jgi:phospholipase C